MRQLAFVMAISFCKSQSIVCGEVQSVYRFGKFGGHKVDNNEAVTMVRRGLQIVHQLLIDRGADGANVRNSKSTFQISARVMEVESGVGFLFD